MKACIKAVLVIGILFSAGFSAGSQATAGKLTLPDGMGGVPDIGAIPCSVFSNMLVVGSKGTRLSLLTWAHGYYYARSAETTDELLAAAESAGESWDFDRLTGHFVSYCAEHPDSLTREAVIDLGGLLLTGSSEP